MIYYGKLAKSTLQKNLNNADFKRCKGYFQDENAWVAFDNSRRDCWVEEFKSEKMAICWLENFFEISEYRYFKVMRITKNWLFIPNRGFMNIKFHQNIIKTKFHTFSI